MIILTSDGVSHGQPVVLTRGSGFRLDTACGLEFYSWLYEGKSYGDRDVYYSSRPRVTAGGVIDCMTCLVRRAT